VLDFVDRETKLADGFEQERRPLSECRDGQDPFHGWLKVPLPPYQVRGAIFAACRGRVILADDMGLGKTIRAIAAAEWLHHNRGIDGGMRERRKKYAAPALFNLASYKQARLDLDLIAGLRPDPGRARRGAAHPQLGHGARRKTDQEPLRPGVDWHAA